MHYPSPWLHTVRIVRHHYYEDKPNFEMAADLYEEWAAFAVESGRFTYAIGDFSGEATTGQIVLCPPGIRFYRHTDSPISFHYALLHWDDLRGEPLAALSPSKEWSSPCLDFRNRDRFHASLATLQSPYDAQHAAYRLWRDHVWLDLFRMHATEQRIPDSSFPGEPDMQLEQARRLLDEAAQRAVTVGEAAALVGMNGVTFARHFQQAYGLKPSAYMARVKLRKVCHLLTHSAMTLEQIAADCGFNNGFYLSRYFSARMGLPPSEYRRQHRV